MSTTDAKIGRVLAAYTQENGTKSPDAALELEIRFKNVTKEMFESLYHAVRTDNEFTPGVLECSVNFISSNIHDKRDPAQYIRKLTFGNGAVTSDTYLTKKRSLAPIHIQGATEYVIGLAVEEPTSMFKSPPNALARFKVRVSFDFVSTAGARWRLDMTMVKSEHLDKLGSNLASIRDSLFRPTTTAANVLAQVDHDLIDSYEIECEFIGNDPTAEDFAVVNKIYSLINPDYINDAAYQEEIYYCAKYIVDKSILHQYKQPNFRLKQLANQVISLSKNTYYSEIYPPEGYFVTDKTDGIRAFITVRDGKCRVVRSDGMTEHSLKDSGDSDNSDNSDNSVLIVDAEIENGIAYLFDAMLVGTAGTNENDSATISGQPFSARMSRLDEAAAILSKYIPCKCKIFERIGPQLTEIAKVWNRTYPYKLDGLILIEPGSSYRETRNYKWKPFENNTIDFLVMKCPSELLGIKPFEVKKGQILHLLFVGISRPLRDKLGLSTIVGYRKMFPQLGEYGPIQFSPSANPLAFMWYRSEADVEIPNGTIVELGRTEDNSEWVFHRTRDDRKMEKGYFGNDYRIAEMTYLNYLSPFNLADLWQPSSGYFTKVVGDIHVAPNRFKRFVISQLLETTFANMLWIIDLAAGRGADLPKIREIGVKNGLFIDIDPLALAELIRRKYSFKSAPKRGRGEGVFIKESDNLTIHTMEADLRTDAADLIASTYQFGMNTASVEGIICNFALHYLCDSANNIRNILTFVARMLKFGGVFEFTVMDGQSVFNLLADLPTGGTWELRENDVRKYAITKRYTSPKLTAAGQTISVLLPFSDEMYDEPLCNVDNVISEAKKLGLELELDGNMLDYKDKFLKSRAHIAAQLTEDDLAYIGLHRYVTLRKVKK